MSKFNAGDPVFVTDPDGHRVRAHVWSETDDGTVKVVTENGWWLGRAHADVELRKRDVPREGAEALLGAVASRIEDLAAEAEAAWGDIRVRESAQDCHSELSEVAEALRLLLEVDP